jgi:alpha-glucosidase
MKRRNSLTIGEELQIRLRSDSAFPADRVFLRYSPDGEQRFVEMQRVPGRNSPYCVWWETSLLMSMPTVHYRFLLIGSDGAWWFTASGLHRYEPSDATDFRLVADFIVPDWVREAAFYQIVPDRFADGDPGSNVIDGEFRYRGHVSRRRGWGELPAEDWGDAHVEFFGGDLRGIEQNLAYLEELGITALYLTPVFTAFSNHRYDVVDYTRVDPHLGGDAALASLRRATAALGMRIILDIVPNHCGVEHPWFRAALSDSSAPTAEFFSFDEYPGKYASWMGHPTLPKLNYTSARLRDLMYEGRDSVFRRWLRPPFAIDGWRIDVANMVGRDGATQLNHDLLNGIRRAVKEENPDALLVGEHFFDATSLLQGDCLDASMNYAGFAHPLWSWLGEQRYNQHFLPRTIISPRPWSGVAMAETWKEFMAGIPWSVAARQFNIIGTHDTPRIRSFLRDDLQRQQVAVSLLMTFPGIPSVFYGDEIGLSGEGTRVTSCMTWDPSVWDKGLHRLHTLLLAVRRREQALREGGFQLLEAHDDAVAYLRDSEESCVVVVARRSSTGEAMHLPLGQADIPEGARFEDVFGGGRFLVEQGVARIPPGGPGAHVFFMR